MSIVDHAKEVISSVRQKSNRANNFFCMIYDTHTNHLIRNAEDLAYLMNWEKREDRKPLSKQLPLIPEDMTKDEKKVFDFIRESEQASIDDIALHCDWPQSKLAIVLLEMEMKGILISLPGKTYKLI